MRYSVKYWSSVFILLYSTPVRSETGLAGTIISSQAVTHEIELNADKYNLSSGVYFRRLNFGGLYRIIN